MTSQMPAPREPEEHDHATTPHRPAPGPAGHAGAGPSGPPFPWAPGQPPAPTPVPPVGVPAPPVRATRPLPWGSRRDFRAAGLVLLAMALVGLLLGVVWYLVAPRLSFRVNTSGQVVPLGPVESEALIGADGWFVVLSALAGVVAGVLCWVRWRSVRGPAVTLGLAAGGLVGALAMSWIGHLIGHGPSPAALRQVGNVVTAPLELRSKVALIVEPFAAVAVYVVGAGFAGQDDLGRSPRPPSGPLPPPDFFNQGIPPR